MRRPGGYALICDPCAPVVEMDTFTCNHCNRIVHVKAKERPEDIGGFCSLCSKMICDRCVTTGDCTPFEKKLEQIERSYHALRSYGLVE